MHPQWGMGLCVIDPSHLKFMRTGRGEREGEERKKWPLRFQTDAQDGAGAKQRESGGVDYRQLRSCAHIQFLSLSLSLSFFHLIFTLLFLPPESADSLPALSNLSLCFSLDPCFAGPSLKRSQKTHSCTSYCCFHFSAPPPISFSPPVRAE